MVSQADKNQEQLKLIELLETPTEILTALKVLVLDNSL